MSADRIRAALELIASGVGPIGGRLGYEQMREIARCAVEDSTLPAGIPGYAQTVSIPPRLSASQVTAEGIAAMNREIAERKGLLWTEPGETITLQAGFEAGEIIQDGPVRREVVFIAPRDAMSVLARKFPSVTDSVSVEPIASKTDAPRRARRAPNRKPPAK